MNSPRFTSPRHDTSAPFPCSSTRLPGAREFARRFAYSAKNITIKAAERFQEVMVTPENGSTAKASDGHPGANGDAISPVSADYKPGELVRLMVFLGTLVGLIAFFYDTAMESSLELVWKIIPEEIERRANEYEGGLELLNRWAFVYTIVASLILAVGAGASVRYLGFPGDLPNVIECVHELGYVPMEQTLSMIMVSLCSIAAGGSLGPEAPLVAVSASVSGWISMHIFKHEMPMVRKCTIIGMSAGLSAFFGVQLGGALFALEVLNTMGMQFFETAVYSIGAGGFCLAVYRGLQGATFGAIWKFEPIGQSTAAEVILGTIVGLMAGATGIFFRSLFRKIGKGVKIIGLNHFEKTDRPIVLAALGGLCVSVLGVLVPPTMFWAEFEIGVIAEPGKELPHIWPPGGLFYGLERYPWETAPMYMLVGFVKMLAIACTVHSGFRGGFIFPLFFAGASIGRGLFIIFDAFLPEGLVNASPVLMCMCFAAGLNVAVTRTPFATPLILATLSGSPNVTAPTVCASLASLFLTRSHKFIGPQRNRQDIDFKDDLPPNEFRNQTSEDDLGDTPDEAGSIITSAARTWSYHAVGESKWDALV